MIYSHEVELMCPVAKGAKHEPAPIPEEGKWVHSKEIKDISGFTHGIGWCAPQQGACKLTLNVKERYYRGSFSRDNRMFRYDSFSGYGSRNFTGQNNSGSFEYRP